jgi:hypothetical protein
VLILADQIEHCIKKFVVSLLWQPRATQQVWSSWFYVCNSGEGVYFIAYIFLVCSFYLMLFILRLQRHFINILKKLEFVFPLKELACGIYLSFH